MVEGATENATTVRALIGNLIERGLDPALPRFFVINGWKALPKAIQATFERDAAVRRCRVRKTCDLLDRLSNSMRTWVRACYRKPTQSEYKNRGQLYDKGRI